jgi:hypothetical protein
VPDIWPLYPGDAVESLAVKSRSGGFGVGFSMSPELCDSSGTAFGSVSGEEFRSYYGEGVDLSLRLAGTCRLASSEVAVFSNRFLSHGQVCLRHPQPHSLHLENIELRRDFKFIATVIYTLFYALKCPAASYELWSKIALP